MWQAPALLGAGLLLVSGVVTAVLTKPKPDPARVFAQAEGLMEREDFPGALDVINTRLRPYYERTALSPEQMRRFRVMRARAVYLGERKNGAELGENAKTINAEYTEAEKLSTGPLEPRDLQFWADANVTLGRYDRALELSAKLPPAQKAERGRIVKRIVETQLASQKRDPEQILRLLTEFLKDPDATPGDRAWAVARQAEFLIRQGQLEAAITKVVQTLPAILSDAPPDELGEVYLLLGGAYAETGALAEASKRLDQALRLLLPTDPRRARAMVLQARVEEQVNPDPAEAKTEAKARYAAVIEQFSGSEARLPALLGLGEVEAAMGDFESSIRTMGELVQELASGKSNPDTPVPIVTASLLDRARARLGAGDVATSLHYGELAERLYRPDDEPADVLLILAQAHRKAAEQMLAPGGATGPGRLLELTKVDAGTREQARVHLVAAGNDFKRHAERIGIENNSGYGESLWMAADSLDLAGDAARAIPLFSDYTRFFPADPKQAEARFRLGQAYQAKGDYITASSMYRGLIDDTRQAASSTGPFADLSYVPLARCLLMDGDAKNDAEAEQMLEQVVTGNAGGPSTPQFRDGLVELAALKARRGAYAEAIQHLEDAVVRFPDDPRIDELRYSLADAYRQDAHAIIKTLEQGLPDRQRQLLEQTRLERLGKAQSGFEQVRAALDARDPRRLSDLNRIQQRNSYFYLGDCAFDLKDYDAAIHHYDAAREKYPTDPASLVAMVQIVNSYIAQGDLDRARTANTRAINFYKSLPPTVWADPNLPMTNAEWQAWLNSMESLMKDRGPARAAVPEQ